MFARISAFAIALLATSASAANPFEPKKTPTGAKAAHINRLVRGAIPTKNSQLHRNLDQDDQAAEELEADITAYSIKFEKCQFVKAFNDELAEEGADTVLATQRFVVFRLCSSSSSSCNYGYGEYMITLEEYLESTVEYRTEQQEEMCNTCDEYCAADDQAANGDDANADADEEDEADEEDAEEDGGDERRLFSRKLDVDCDTCVTDCEKIENMEENFYIDATNFVNCVQIQEEGDDGSVALYAGPMCSSQGSKIKIGVFEDEDCMFLDTSKDVENYIADGNGYSLRLSHALLKTTYDNSEPISCLAEPDGDDDQAEAQTTEVCAELYQEAAKCEKTHGFDNGIANYYDSYETQIANEELVCDFISSLKSGTYSQDGEIVVGGSSSFSAGGTSTTGGQKFALTFFILGTVGLAVYAAMLHTQLTKGGKADLSTQGGAMA